ncbi:pullulanase-type alpha-1,6-glucosidase [Aliiglaciecola sp. CAU 1673]|uniref:pullulanase-type alpha-1,6-glucosidase n=1 Tax=Aliiglaciecola sp. CAU 1673 TaxID=3032595 RepID=UPI0023D9E471|nr:pullulanase-type alpha-1,6-glucosidase [Aliiglaciecola sp. CAU 1673]MDF2179025.1 pullulanase-type alpha-1,6-glucosidase [Aliiglaciecola sp. CAU 1673]
MFASSKTLTLAGLMLAALVLAGCGGSDVEPGETLLTCDVPNIPDASGTSCVPPPPIQCDPPTVPDARNESCVVGADPNAPDPVFFPGADQAVLYYNRAAVGADNSTNDSSYEGYRLHTWSNDTCNAYSEADTDWANGRNYNGIDPNYGAYWILDLKPGYAGTEGACGNFIIHIGTDDAGKEMGGGDFKMPLSQDDPTFARMNFTFSGVPSVFEFPIVSLGPQPVKIDGAAAHWLTADILVWELDNRDLISELKLHHSAAADLKVDVDTGLNGQSLTMVETELSDALKAKHPQLANWPAYKLDVDSNQAKSLLKSQLVAAAYDLDGNLSKATAVQTAKVLDALYTAGDNDADEAELGPVYADGQIKVSVWAPTAQSVKLNVYNTAKSRTASHAMSLNEATGIWSYTGTSSLDRQYYRFELSVYHPVSAKLETLEVTDPYSLSLSTNGRFSQFVNLEDADLKPAGWEGHSVPTVADPEDIIIYEGHIRDFSGLDESTSTENRGKYLAFTEADSAPVSHLKMLVENGLNHFHLLPSADMATVNEDPSKSVDLNSTVQELCRLNRQAQVCSEENPSATLLSVFESYDPFTEPTKAQQLAEDMRGVDRFNWGYDPHHYTVPEGSYASNAEGVARILETRAMIQSLHEMGLRVVQDVVYNHTNASGLNDKSVLDKVVPGYYHRYDLNSGGILRETCCDDTEPRHRMMEKLMQDSLLTWTEQYKFDGFRFDIMSHASKETMLALREAVQAVDADNYFYGEGWTRTDRGFEQANQPNMAGTEIATFNDRLREAVRQGAFFSGTNSNMRDQDRLKMGLAGTLKNYVLKDFNGIDASTSVLGGYAEDPADIINYVSKHDNETLWDQLQYVLPQSLNLNQRVRVQNIAASIPLMSQGIPFLQLGGDLLRSKSMDRDAYDSGDWFNRVDFTYQHNNWNVGLPLADKNQGRWAEMGGFIYNPQRDAGPSDIGFAASVFQEFLKIRSTSKLFRLTSGQDIIDRVGFHNIGKNQTPGLIVMSIDDGLGLPDLDPMHDALVVVINGTASEQSHTVRTATGFSLHSAQQNSVDALVQEAGFSQGEGEGTFSVPAYTTAVFVKTQSGAQGEGLSAYATAGAPDVVPYGSTTVYVRGSLNGWSENDPMSYQGNGVYQRAIALTGGAEIEFKIASADWSTVDFGALGGDTVQVNEGEEKVLGRSGANLKFAPAIDATYLFILDASNPDAPVLRVRNEEPFPGTTVYVRGSLNGWGTDNPMSYDGAGLYSAEIDVTAGNYEFKVASADWSTVDFGAANGPFSLGDEIDLSRSGPNIGMNFGDSTQYYFAFDASNLDAPTLTVNKSRMFGDTVVYIRGGMNGWGAVDALVFQGKATYSVDIALSAGVHEFKVASEDWATVNLGVPPGGTSDVVIGQAKVLGGSNDNLRIEVTNAGTYRFTVKGPSASAPTVSVTPVP